MRKVGTRILFFLLGVLVSLAVLSPSLFSWGVKPYTNVVIHKEQWDKDGLLLQISFLKNGQCKLISFSSIAFSGSLPRYVDYVDLDNLPEDYDREEGAHSLNIKVILSPEEVDFVELRTRHRCIVDEEGNTEVITKVFSRHDSP